MKVLIIDDDTDIRRITQMSLEKVGGMTVSEAPGGEAGLAAARDAPPDVVLLDVMMPGMDGPAVLAALRADPATSEIPVVFLTARMVPGEIRRLRELGAAGVIIKPFDPMTLPRQLRDMLPLDCGRKP